MVPLVRIVTPALADANNGNWRTAHRWQTLLSPTFKVIVQGDWTDESCDILIALHARRSAAAIVRFRAAHPNKPLIVVLTGTDLYRDLEISQEARQSLDLADALIVLQEDAIQFIPIEHRKKTHVVYQSAKQLTPTPKLIPKLKHKLNCVVVGHLRDEKDPAMIFRAVEKLGPDDQIHILHIGAPLDEALAATAQNLATQHEHYHWSGAMAHGLTRAAIKRAHVLIHPSIMEGGANVIVEALTSGTPVIASKMSGNVGMLGQKYVGYFPVGDEIALVALLKRCADDPNFMSRLSNACQARAKLFLPETERDSLRNIVDQLLLSAN